MQEGSMAAQSDSENKKCLKELSASEKDPRSPVVTRSKSKSLAVQDLKASELADNFPSTTVISSTKDTLKRKHSNIVCESFAKKTKENLVKKKEGNSVQRDKVSGRSSTMSTSSSSKNESNDDSLSCATSSSAEVGHLTAQKNLSKASNVVNKSVTRNEQEKCKKAEEKFDSFLPDNASLQPLIYEDLSSCENNEFNLMIDENMYSMPCMSSNKSSFVTCSRLEAAIPELPTFPNNESFVKLDGKLQNLNFLSVETAAESIASSNDGERIASVIQPHMNFHAEMAREPIFESSNVAETENESKFVNVIQFSPNDKASTSSGQSSRSKMVPETDTESKFIEVLKFGPDKPSSSSASSHHNKIKHETESGSKLIQLVKLSKNSDVMNRNRCKQLCSLIEKVEKASTSKSAPVQMETCSDSANRGKNDIASASNELNSDSLSEMHSVLENAACSSHGAGAAAGAATSARDAEAKDSEIGRLQALLEARGIPLHVFGALGHRMQHLFQRSMGSNSSSRAQQLLQGLQAVGDEGQQLQSVIEMCQLLVMGNEDTLIGFPVKQVVPVLINLLNMEHNFEMMNNACRALTYLMEALPRSSSVVVEAIPIFLNKLQYIQCMDVAEQSLTALEMLSRWHSKAILHAKGISICLLYFDFFSINAQRAALAVSANCCQNIMPDEFCLVQDSLPLLSGWLTNHDEKSVESICLAFSRLVECLQLESKYLKEIVSHNLLSNLQQLLIVSPSVISSQTFTIVIRMLAVMCTSSAELSVLLLQQNISETLRYLLIGNSDASDDIKLTPRSHQELFEMSYLISELAPRLPPDGIFSIDFLITKPKYRKLNQVIWKWRDDSGLWHPYSTNDSRIIEAAYQCGEDSVSLSEEGKTHTCTVDLNSMQQINSQLNTKRPLQRCIRNSSEINSGADNAAACSNDDCFNENSELVITCVKSLFPVLYEIYCSSAGPSVRYNCLRAMLRMMHFSPPNVLQLVLKKQMMARQIAAMLASQDLRIVISALQMADILIQKLPGVFGVFFVREGVMHEIKLLSEVDIKSRTAGLQVANNPSCSHSIVRTSSSVISYNSFLSSGSENVLSAQVSPSFETAQTSARSARKEEAQKSEIVFKMTDMLTNKQFMKLEDSATRKELCLSQNSCLLSPSMCEKVSTWIKEQARKLDKMFGVEQFDYSHPAVSVLNRLTTAVKQLESMCDNGLQALSDICDVMTESDISSFELIHSDLINKLHLYLTIPQGGPPPFGASLRKDRLRTFLHVFMSCPLSPNSNFVPKEINPTCLTTLISKLNACVSQLEQFAVKVHDLPSSGIAGRRGTSALKFFNTHQLKCNFQRHPECSNLRQWRGGPVMIDPLASIHNIDRYLVNQGYGVLMNDDDDEDDESEPSEDDNSDEDMDDMANAIRINQMPGSHKLQFLIGRNILPYNMTVYQAIRQYGGEGQSFDGRDIDSEDPVGYSSTWGRTHTISYRPIPPEEVESTSMNDAAVVTRSRAERRKRTVSDISSHAKEGVSDESKYPKRKSDFICNQDSVPEVSSPLAVLSNLPKSNAVQDPSLEVIYLLRVLHTLSCSWGVLYQMNTWEPAVPQAVFINSKLTLKANRQIQDLLAIMTGNIPAWLSQIAYDFPFLFPFQTRYLLFYIVSFDRERALQRLIDVMPEIRDTEKITPKLDRRKKAVSRDNILKQAEAVLQDIGNSKALLEIQYKSEVGTGLGPTLEFYALVSKELQKADLDMWRGDKIVDKNAKGQPVDYMYSATGLFPLPLSRNVKGSSLTKLCNKFRLLGNFLAKALMDSRLLDIPLSLVFYKWMLNQENALCLADLKHIDEGLAHTILKLEQLVVQKKEFENDSSLDPAALKSALDNLTFDGCALEDLNLDFTLPGFSHIEMKKAGKDTAVSIDNLEEYLTLLKHWTVKEGIWRQMKAFREGFESVFSLNQLKIFYPDELEQLFCGKEHSQWDVKSLMDCCRPDHGYTYESCAIKFFFEILSSYDRQQQRRFLQFVTGSPRLPVGGLKSLTPPLTIVRRTLDNDEDSDKYLPSVMTCVNYLKLPDYSSIVVMRERLDIALSEGQHSFHLS